jgi:putative endonuclease
MRKNDQYGSASETVTPLKKKRLALTAMDYLSRYAICPPCRFDVIAIEPDPQGATHLMHYENAFIFEEEGLQ